MRKKIFIIIIIISTIIFTFIVIDYSRVLYFHKPPILSIKEQIKDGYIYKSLIINYYKCDNKEIYVTNKKNNYSCPHHVEFINDYFTNSKNFKIHKTNYDLLIKKYLFTKIDNIKSEEELIKSLNIVNELYINEYCNTDIENVVSFKTKNNNEYICQNNLYCIKYENNELLFSPYLNEECSEKWNKIAYKKEICSYLKDEIYLKEYDFIDFNRCLSN